MNPKTVLYVEDEDDDVFFMKKAFGKAGIATGLQVVGDGQQAIDYLAGQDPYADRKTYPMPCMVLLDLNLPRKHGLEVLQWIRKQPAFYTLVVVILTSSDQDPDIHRAYSAGANAYLVKPPTADGLLELARTLGDFWLIRNQTPPDCSRFK